MWAAIGAVLSFALSSWSSGKQKDLLEEQQQYQASQSYSAAVRSVALTREQRQQAAQLAAEGEAASEEILDLQTQMAKALENAQLVEGGTSGPIVKPVPVESILLPAAIAYAVSLVMK